MVQEVKLTELSINDIGMMYGMVEQQLLQLAKRYTRLGNLGDLKDYSILQSTLFLLEKQLATKKLIKSPDHDTNDRSVSMPTHCALVLAPTIFEFSKDLDDFRAVRSRKIQEQIFKKSRLYETS